jgi:hypothetical protein
VSSDRDAGRSGAVSAKERRDRGFRLGDATPSSRFLLVLVAASLLLAIALARAAETLPQFPQ